MARRRMTDHELHPSKGWNPPYSLDHTAKFSAAQLAAVSGGVAFNGRCVHVNASGEYEFGVSGIQMPIWLFANSDDPAVANDGGDPSSVAGAWVAGQPTGQMTGIPAMAGVELTTTEFDATRTYAYNDPLYAPTGTTLATCGVLTNAGIGGAYWPAVSAVALVSVGRSPTTAKNVNFKDELSFWPVFMPGMNGRTEPAWA